MKVCEKVNIVKKKVRNNFSFFCAINNASKQQVANG